MNSPSQKTPGRIYGFKIPRLETFMLITGLACTVFGKTFVIAQHQTDFIIGAVFQSILPDILFFAVAALIIRCLFILKPSPATARFTLTIAMLIMLWSIADLAWMMRSGVQLQPGIIIVMLRDFRDLWPLIKAHIRISIKPILTISVFAFTGAAFFLWKFVYPAKIIRPRNDHIKLAVAKILIVIILLPLGLVFDSVTQVGFSGEVLGFSGHWHAIVYSTVGIYRKHHSDIETTNIPLAGKRNVIPPDPKTKNLPNIVIVLLESVSYSKTSLYEPKLNSTPYLASLAKQGAEFQLARVPVSHTTKAYWATLTGSIPVIQSDYVEAIPVEHTYEGLPSILAGIGYKSAFFEMSKGSFECAPGFFKNLGFDWASFRENLQDESAHIGYLSGDDCRMIEPAMEWLTSQNTPTMLMMITSVSHDPFAVPEWFAKPKENLYDNYIQSLRYTDYFLRQLCNQLKERGLEQNTLLCIMGDHGTSFRSSTDLARWCPFEEVLRVPWIIKWPNHIEPGQKIDWPCSQLDVTPTILNLLGYDISKADFDGKDAFEPSDPNRRLFFSSWYKNSPIGFVEGTRKIVYWPYLDKVFAYDLQSDPGEENPKRIQSERAEKLKQQIINWQETSKIVIDPRRYTEDLLYEHWQTFSAGRNAWAYYVP